MRLALIAAALLGACAAVTIGSTANAAGTDLGTYGQWTVVRFDYATGRTNCLMVTKFPNLGVTITLEAGGGDETLGLFVSYDNWKAANSFTTRLDLVFDGGAQWGQDHNASAAGNSVHTQISATAAREFVHLFTSGTTMRITIQGATSPLPAVGLAGTTAAFTPFMECAKVDAPAIVASLGVPGAAPAVAPVVQSAIAEVALLTNSGVKRVQGVAGGSIAVMFVLDSGAADVQLPRAVAAELALEGALVNTGRTATYVTADGRRSVGAIYMLNSLTVGGRTVTDVQCSITDTGDPLLGQSFLGRLGSWSINNAKQTLVMGPA